VTSFEDWLAIHTLVMIYAEHIDSARFAEAAAMFENATYRVEHLSEQYQSPAELQEFFASRRLFADGTPRTKHVFTNVIIEVDGHRAHASSYATVFQQTDELPLQPIACGRYLDTFERRGDGWRFTDRLITEFLLGDRSQHVPWAEASPAGERPRAAGPPASP
jgi:SnoaL-like domain